MTFSRALLLTSILFSSAAIARASDSCQADDTAVVTSEARCFPSGGVDIGFYEDDGIKVACMQDKRVRTECGPDGRVTRLRAYQEWMSKIEQFQSACSAKGGQFAYQDPNFTEPQDESFCLQAQPEVGTNMFEDQLCNYRSLCPAVTVLCEHPCGRASQAEPAVHVTLR